MESTTSNIFVDSCQYTPVYFLEDPSITQAKSYVVTQNTTNLQKPVSDNLKRFYENSGKLENNLHVSERNKKPRILRKCENGVGNNLKLASFLMPKPETSNKQITVQANNVLLKPVYIANTPNIVNNVPKLDVNSKIVQLKEIPNITRTISGKIVPKIKAKEIAPNAKHTSVQLIKLGETYHSLNQLSEEQMKIVNHALKIFSNPKEQPQKPTYDPVTNTKFIYKVVSPKELTVAGKNELLMTQNKAECVMGKKDLLIAQKKPAVVVQKNDVNMSQKIPEILVQKNDVMVTQKVPEILVQKKDVLIAKKPEFKKLVKKIERKEPVEPSVKIPIFFENAVTKTGRKVRVSKNILPEEITNKQKKVPNVASCHHCSIKFNNAYRLQRHYEFNPTHSPDRLHSNLFQCLLAIMKNGAKENRVNILLDQLEDFICKLRSCVPCLLEENEQTDGMNSIINENISSLLGTNPGKYKVNIEGLECERDVNGFCEHNPPQHECDNSKIWMNEPTTEPKEIESEINELIKLPCKRVEPRRHQPEQNTISKKLKVNPNNETLSITDDDIVALLRPPKTENTIETNTIDNEKCDDKQVNNDTKVLENPIPNHIQFRSTHFDIRSSPIKPSANTFSKFQINTENMSKYKVHIIRPLQLSETSNEDMVNNTNMVQTQQLLIQNTEESDFSALEQFNGTIPKDWTNLTNDLIKNNSVSDTSKVIQPALLHIEDSNPGLTQVYQNEELTITDRILADQEQTIDPLNFLESLGNECIYPETEIRNNSVDFHLDLFSFNTD